MAATKNRRRTLSGIEKCLANKRILFIGDSRTRYQYTTLATLLAYEQFPRCKEAGNVTKVEWMCQMTGNYERDWKSFLQTTNIALNTNHTNEQCYCMRDKVARDATRENRFFNFTTKYGSGKLDMMITGPNNIYVDKEFHPFSNTARCKVGTLCPASKQEQFMNIATFLEHVAEKFRPTHVFASSGWAELDIGCILNEFTQRSKAPSWMISNPTTPETLSFLPRNRNLATSLYSIGKR